jgi:hypothetical protein
VYALRRWSVRHSRLLTAVYRVARRAFERLEPLWRAIGYARLERPVAALESVLKGALFDCRMCGRCVLSSTGMACPMNCPKDVRNGPCGGVRADGGCEVAPAMPCVWVEAWEGSRNLPRPGLPDILDPVDHGLRGSSSWLRLLRESGERR